MTRIVSAAIRIGDMIVSVPAPGRHGDVFHKLYDINRKLLIKPHHQGFLTDAGTFVTRREAKIIAREAGQLLPREHGSEELFSEDVW